MLPKGHENRSRFLEELLENAMLVKRAHEAVAEYGRSLYSGEQDLNLESGEPAPNDNQFRKVVDRNAVKLGRGDPKPTATPRYNSDKPFLTEPAQEFSQRLEIVYDTHELSDDIVDGETEAGYCGMSCVEVRPDFTIEPISYFDVYADNFQGKPGRLADTCRYVFVRRFMDAKKFIETYGDQLANVGIQYEMTEDGRHTLPTVMDGRVPGRAIVGTRVRVRRGRATEHYTAGDKDAAPLPTSPYAYPSSSVDSDEFKDETLVPYWECWIKDDESPTGWKHLLAYEATQFTIFHEDNWYEFWDGPMLFMWAAMRVQNQLYQPADVLHLIGTQLGINYISKRMLDQLKRVVDPDVFAHISTLLLEQNTGGITLSGGKTIAVARDATRDIKRDEPQKIDPAYLSGRQQLQQDIASSVPMAADIHTGSTDQTGVTSGRAINALRSEASEIMVLRIRNRDVVLTGIAKALAHLILEEEVQAATMAARRLQHLKLTGEELPEDDEDVDAALEEMYPEPDPMDVMGLVSPRFFSLDGEMVTHDTIEHGLSFSWEIKPTISDDEENEIFMVALQQASQMFQEDKVMQIEAAGFLSQQKRPAKGLRQLYEERLMELGIDPAMLAMLNYQGAVMSNMPQPPGENGGPPKQSSNGKTQNKETENEPASAG